MGLNTNGQNALVSGGLGNAVNRISAHTGDPSTTGANEVTGGTYARQAVTWNAAASGQRTNNGAIAFAIPAGTDVYFLGLWDTSGPTFYGYTPLGGTSGTSPKAGHADATADTITSAAHGLTNGLALVVFDIEAAGAPTGLTEGTVYFVVGAATDTFQVSATSGGSAVNITASGPVGFQQLIKESFGGGGTLTVADATLTLDGRFA